MNKKLIVLGVLLVCIIIVCPIVIVAAAQFIFLKDVLFSEPKESKEIVVEMKTLEPPEVPIPEEEYRLGSRVSYKIPGADLEKPPTLLTIVVCKMFPNPANSRKVLDKDLNIYYLNGRAWKLDDPKKSNDLKRQLITMGKWDPDQTIIISIGPNTYQYKLIQLLKVCKKAGLKNLIIIPDDSIKFQPYDKDKK